MLDTLKSTLTKLPQTQDVGIAILLVMTVALMVIPMPTMLVDVLIGVNFGIAALLLMTAVYLKSPLDLSALPGIILISTIFRLSLSITTTRLILAEGDAGTIVRTFGEFVIAGNVVVGLVVFLIITIVQFMVISKGAERVAEVGARFTLDALPGKQMAIDAELRNGDIDQAEARSLRNRLGRESQLYGAMDGAMKFVKGDSIAGLIITAINLLGGFAIGTMQRGLPFNTALVEYSLLTVGDALIAQIPALLMSITAATIVTRVASEKEQNLGRDIAMQLFADARALWMAAALLMGMGLLPGFPTPILGGLALLFASLAWIRGRAAKEALADGDGQAKGKSAKEAKAGVRADTGTDGEPAVAGGTDAAPAEDEAGADDKALTKADEEAQVRLVLSEALFQALDHAALRRAVAASRQRVTSRLGIDVPAVGLGGADMEPGAYRIEIEDVPAAAGYVRADRVHVAMRDRARLAELNVEHETLPDGRGAIVGAAITRAKAEGIAARSATGVLSQAVEDLLEERLSTLIGIQETKAFFEAHEARYGDIMREVVQSMPLPRLAEVLRALLAEQVSLRNLRLILEAMVEAGPRFDDPVLVAEFVRIALKRQLSYQHATPDKRMSVIVLTASAEAAIQAAARDLPPGLPLPLDEEVLADLEAQLKALREGYEGEPPLIVAASMDVRRHVHALFKARGCGLPVLSYQSLSDEFTVTTVGALHVEAPDELAPAPAPQPLDEDFDFEKSISELMG